MTKTKESYYWPIWFSQLLRPAEQKKIKEIIPALSRAQVYLWRALNIYDDFLDGEGEVKKLPAANRYYRLFFKTHYELRLNSGYYDLLNKTLEKLDHANQTETASQKLLIRKSLIIIPKELKRPNGGGDLAKKSLALAFGPLALLAKLGYKISDKKFQAALNFFRYALAAKQLSDDSHDWQEDLKRGLMTTANYLLIQASQEKKIKLKLDSASINANLLYAQVAAPRITKNLEALCRQAKKELLIFSASPSSLLIFNLITPLETACYKAKKFRSLIV